jgi:nicotinate phosphoribosyltransferase
MFHIASIEEIRKGKVTDVYFERTLQVLKAKGIDKRVKAEFICKKLPNNWPWAVLAGVEECMEIFRELPVMVRSMPEGTIFRAYEPVMEIEGNYSAFGKFETVLLGLLCQASGVATKAARLRKLAENRTLISFGGRRVHPAIAPMVERNAYIGGCDGVAIVKSAELIGEQPSGTIPHALVLMMGSTIEAVRAFHEVIEPKVKRVALIDTFNDEKFEAINVAEEAGDFLYALRLDTPGSRKGDFLRILEEVRWELNLRGYGRIKLFVSGGLNEDDIIRLNPVVDGYGIGTSISNARVVDFAMDIVEIEGKPIAKRGKMSGSKRVLRCPKCHQDQTVPLAQKLNRCPCGGKLSDLLEPLVKKGRLVKKLPSHKEIRQYVLKQLRNFPL